MRVIGVIDVRGGRAVHARGGQRASYEPIRTAAGTRVDGDAVALAGVYVEQLGVGELYVADLDAIEDGSGGSSNVVSALLAMGVPTWVDAGVTTAQHAARLVEKGAATVIVGLETLSDFGALDAICAGVGGERVAFSADLRAGALVAMPNVVPAGWGVVEVAARGARAGARQVIVLDLARVGGGVGIDVDLVGVVRRAVPEVALFAGGGVRAVDDLHALRAAGCDGALVATALLDGAIRGDDV